MIVEAKVIKSFKHTNTGRIWFDGDTFRGTESDARQLAKRGYLELCGDMPAAGAARKAGEPPLASMTVRELEAIAKERGVELPPKTRKADIIAAIEAAG